jgi:aminoglycoside phosphotransferase (APT) family kinase protein
VDERPRAEALFAELPSLEGFEPTLVHGDLGPEHLRCREGRLVGVIDWGDARIGDPALDYAWLLNVPFPHWDVDEELRRRARVYHRLGPWYEAHYGLFTSKPAHVDAGLRGIRARL